MANKALTTESIALTEKKMEMSLEEIIKMSKKNGPAKGKGKRPPRVSNKNQGYKNGGRSQANTFKVQNFLDSRSSIRQGVLAKRRSNQPGRQFPLITEAARKAANAPIANRGLKFNKTRVAPMQRKIPNGRGFGQDNALPRQRQTLDARFADAKEQRMRVMSQQMTRGGFSFNASRRPGQQQPRQQQPRQQQRGRFEDTPREGRRFDNFQKY